MRINGNRVWTKSKILVTFHERLYSYDGHFDLISELDCREKTMESAVHVNMDGFYLLLLFSLQQDSHGVFHCW